MPSGWGSCCLCCRREGTVRVLRHRPQFYPWLFLVRLQCRVVFAARAARLPLGSYSLEQGVLLIARIRSELFLLFDGRLLHGAVAFRISFFGSFAVFSHCCKIMLIFLCSATGAFVFAFGFAFRRHCVETNRYKSKRANS